MDIHTMSLWQILIAGGPVMWPILLCSILALALIAERGWYFFSIRVDMQKLLSDILGQIKRHQIKEAIQICDTVKHPMAQLLKAGILKYDRPRSQIKEAIEDASLYEIPKIERNIPVLATIATIMPLLGLLGTAIGMVRSFEAIAQKSANLAAIAAQDLSGGIGQALLATVAALVVAIPTFVAYHYLANVANNAILDMEKASTELINFLTE